MFNPDGTARKSNLKIVNLRPTAATGGVSWEEVRTAGNIYKSLTCHSQVGSWNTESGLDIKDIVWPDNSHVPPQGVPEKFSIKITFLEEAPFIIISDPDPVTGRCSMDRGVSCSIPK